MRSLLRGLAGAVLVLGLAALGTGPAGLSAQDKKKDAKDPKGPVAPAKKDANPKGGKDDPRDHSVSFATSDGLALNGYWFQGNAIDKQRPDAVMMFPAPGNKVNDTWLGLAKELSTKNFSVLLFDWRGCGLNAPDTAGSRIFENSTNFWNETYNQVLLKDARRTIDDKGLDYRSIAGRNKGAMYYSDFMLNDLMAARFYLDKQNDNGKCNTNRVWIVTEKAGGPLALGFIATEFSRNTIYNPKSTPLEGVQFKAAGKDYVGLTCLSYGGSTGTASAAWRNGLTNLGTQARDEAHDHLARRLAMVMVYGKKEGASGAKSAFSQVGVGGLSDDALRTNFKYPREVDNSKQTKAISGIDLIAPMDAFGAQDQISKAMVEISKDKQNFGKDPTERDANKSLIVPRFLAEKWGVRR